MGKIDGAGRKPLVRTFEYDFTRDGGAVSAISLTELDGESDSTLNDNDVILRCWTESVTAATSGGAATIALGFTGNADAFEAATAYTDNSYDTPDTIDAKESELPIKLSASSNVIATIATAALTAGKFRVHVLVIPGA